MTDSICFEFQLAMHQTIPTKTDHITHTNIPAAQHNSSYPFSFPVPFQSYAPIFQDAIADSRLTLRSNSLPTNRTPNLTNPTPIPLHRNRRRHSRAMTRHRRRLQLYTSLIRLDAGDAAVQTVEFHRGGCSYGCGGTGDWICWFC